MHGSADKATVPSGSVLFHQMAGSSDKTLKLYEGHAHDLLNDVGKEGVIADIVRWIEERLHDQSAVASRVPRLVTGAA
jgi:acylglycerol lipase